MAQAKFPKEIFVYLDQKSDGFDIEARDSLHAAAYGLNPGETMRIAKYVIDDGEPGTYASKLHYIPKGAKAK